MRISFAVTVTLTALSALAPACGGDEFSTAPADGGAGGADDGSAADASDDATASGDAAPHDGGHGDGGAHDADASDDAPAACNPPCPTGFACEGGLRCADHASAHFSPSSNPSGNWTYGEVLSLGGSFLKYPSTGSVESTLQTWTPLASTQLAPSVFFNAAGATKIYQGSFTMDANALGVYPGPNGEYSVVRFTSPVSGTFAIHAIFTGLSGANNAPPSTTSIDVFIKQSVVAGKTMNTNGAGNVVTYDTQSQSLSAGDTVDFMVGYGTDDSSSNDPVGVEATFVVK